MAENNTVHDKANDLGEWSSNKEMNPAADSSVTEHSVLSDESRGDGDSWRDDDTSHSAGAAARKAPDISKSGSPTPTPGSAEGVENFDKTGNE